MELDTLTYAVLARDAYVLRLKETEKGREYLEKCWRFKQTQPDKAALREQFNK